MEKENILMLQGLNNDNSDDGCSRYGGFIFIWAAISTTTYYLTTTPTLPQLVLQLLTYVILEVLLYKGTIV